MGLRNGDLKDLINPVFEIDSYKSKMGNDSDIVVLSFEIRDKEPAQDLVNFIENGYSFVLDSDLSTGEMEDGTYRVFVEIERDENIPNQVLELMDGVSKLAGQNDFRYRYYKGFETSDVNEENLLKDIPLDNESYEKIVTESNMNNFKNFFSNSYVDSIVMENENELIIKKAYADPLGFKINKFGQKDVVLESIEEKINMNDFAEIIFLTKYLGNYNISKFGNKTITLENKGHVLVVERL